jgi:[ribosomal protein S5]-alanine N-acetyltransferase
VFRGDTNNLPPYGESEAQQWVERNLASPLYWAIEVDGRLLGEIGLAGLNSQDCRARLGIGIYDVAQLGRGLGREAFALVLSYAFSTLALHRVDARVLAFNERAIRCYQACGFIEEGRERESGRIDGHWYDDIIMGLLAQDYRADLARVSNADIQAMSSIVKPK